MSQQSAHFASFLIKTCLITLAMVAAANSQAKEVEYEIKGMKCGACVDSIKEKVCGQKGVTKCNVEVGKMTLTLDDKNAPSDDKISSLVKDAGHFKVIKSTPVTSQGH